MLFNSLIFLLFGAAFFVVWPLLRKNNTPRWIYLVSASFFFYGWWDWRFLFLIIGSGLIDFFAGQGMQRFPDKKRLFLYFSLIGNIGSLASFKYSGFIAENIESILSMVGFDIAVKSNIPDFFLIVPIGISFYTFQSMSYTIDVYRDKMEPTKNILHFFAYLSLFPQLVAGPIVRAKDFLNQLTVAPKTTEKQRWDGLQLIVRGFFKKVVIADSIAPIVNEAYNAGSLEPSSLYWWIIVLMFSTQIYCDFSGYSDIARGLAKWMGYEFLLNFNRPFISRSVQEFWTRWHISLSFWFRDYVYFPLGGSKVSSLLVHRNIWITLLISGLWHGAAWTYIFFGVFHGIFMSLERFTNWPERIKRNGISGFLGSGMTMFVWVMSLVLFRSMDIKQAGQVFARLLAFDFSSFQIVDEVLFAKAALLTVFSIGRELYFWFELDKYGLGSERIRLHYQQFSLALLIVGCVFLRGPGSSFIYFQF